MKRLLLVACMLFSLQYVNAQTTAEKKEELKAVLGMCEYILATPADTTDFARDMALLSIGIWMMAEEDYEFASDSASARIMNTNLEVGKVFTAAMVEYQVNKKVNVYDDKARLAVATRVAKYIDDPDNMFDVSKSRRLQNLIFNWKDGELEEWLEWLERQDS